MLLRSDPPDVVFLQEVVRRSWHAHIKHHYRHAGFRSIPEDPTDNPSEYFCVLWVREELGRGRGGADRFENTGMGRQLVWAEVPWNDTSLLLMTSHLESTKGASVERVAQLASVVDRMVAHPGPAVFGGDTNLRKAEEPQVQGLELVDDAWTAAGEPRGLRATWPSVPMSKRPGARFDRVLVKGLSVASFSLLGHDAPLFGGAPSDHLAVEVVVESNAS